MKKIAIIAAMDEEMLAVKELMDDVKTKKIYETAIIEGVIENKECVLVKCRSW